MKRNARPPYFSLREMRGDGLSEVDFVFISGDAYVDHPSFSAAVISRVLISNGYTVGLIPQPDWHDKAAFCALGRPRLAFSGAAIACRIQYNL